MSRLSDLISFANFAGKPRRGQIATLIMVMMVAVLICALMIANLGHLSVRVARVENAADRTSLALGSQLATRANVLCKSLGSGTECITEQCRPTGLLGTIIAVVAAVIVTIFVPPVGALMGQWLAGLFGATVATAGTTAVALGGALAGAIGGGIGGGIVQGTWGGAFAGAASGAATGFGIGSMAGALGHVSSVATTRSVMQPLMKVTYQSVPKAILGAGAGAGGGMIGGPHVSGTVMGDQYTADQLVVIGKKLSGLPDYERIRESVLHQALSDVIDDPNKTRNAATNPEGICYFPETGDAPQIINGDPLDVDGDGNVTESIPCFDHWWAVRAQTLKEHLGRSAEGVVRYFIDGRDPSGASISLKQFRAETQNYLQGVERGNIEATCPPPPLTALTAGPAIRLWNFLLENNYLQFGPMESKFWDPSGPGKAELVSWLMCTGDCDQPTPAGFDSVDHSRLRYENFLAFAKGIIWDPSVQPEEDENGAGQLTEKDWIKGLADNYPELGRQLYVADPSDPAYPGSWYNQLGVVRDGSSESPPVIGLEEWINKTTEAREKLPDCHIAWGGYTPAVSTTTSWETPFCRHDLNNDPPRDPPIFPSTNADAMPAATEGPHLRGGTWDVERPECKASTAHKALLTAELARVERFVNDLPAYIASTHLSPGSPQALPMPCEGGCANEVTSGLVSIDKVCMSKDRPDSPDQLSYAFTYTWTCVICDWSNPEPPAQPECNVCSSETHVETAEFSVAIGAPHVSVPCSERGAGPGRTGDAVGEFLGRVRALQSMVGRMDPPFGTIDADEEDEFTPVIDTRAGREGLIRKQVLATNQFLNRVAEFHERITAVRAGGRTAPAQDGSLPNVAQLINGRPIDGTYAWFDSLGNHEVNVEMGPWKLPSTENKKCGISWLKGQVCLQLRDYCDGQPAADDNCKKPPAGRCRYKEPGDRGRTRITIRRNDPNNRELKFWTWDPFPSSIKKEAFSRYNVDTVGIDRVR